MYNEAVHISNDEMKDYLAKGRELYALWSDGPASARSRYSSVDAAILRSIELDHGVVVVNMRRQHGRLNLSTMQGWLTGDDVPVLMGTGPQITLDELASTTTARFAESLGTLLQERKNAGHQLLKNAIPDSIFVYAGRTQRALAAYAR